MDCNSVINVALSVYKKENWWLYKFGIFWVEHRLIISFLEDFLVFLMLMYTMDLLEKKSLPSILQSDVATKSAF